MSQMGPIEYFICGGFGGVCTVLVGHPLDTLKVRLQTMPIPKAGEAPMYGSAWHCFIKTVRYEGFRGLYKGMGAPLIAVTPIFAINFLGYGIGKKIFGPPDSYRQYFFAGAFAGLGTTIIMAPGERIKCLLQIQQGLNAPKIYTGPIDCFIKLYKQGGLASIYRGSGATIFRDMPSGGMYFLSYEAIKNYMTNNGTKPITMLGTIFAGGAAGIGFWIVGMPPDVLKSRLQTAPEGTYPNGMRDVFKGLMKNEGPLALYKGISPVLLRAFPANAACFLGFELCYKFLIYLKSLKMSTREE